MNSQRLLERFLEYVQIDTTSDDGTDLYPSTPGQLELGKVLVNQFHEMGLDDVKQDEHGIVLARLPGNVDGTPAIAFNAHFDTSPETPGAGVQPQLVEAYAGGDIPLPGRPDRVITVDQCPELANLVGKTLITTDGNTLLGGDDKAGIAIMMELAQHLIEHPDVPRGPLRLLFTCDEEIGRGVKYVDVDKLDAVACYTFDGGGQDEIDVETFSADLAVVTFTGANIHPAIAKDKMVNALRAAGHFVAHLPGDQSPERTDGREGFLHPYAVEGGVANVALKIILRSFATPQLQKYAAQLRDIAAQVELLVPGCHVEVKVTKQYRNLADGLAREPRAVQKAVEAHQHLGREARLTQVRGGTDGSQLTERGLPTPNLSSGQHNIHSPLEFACLEEMVAACQVGMEIVTGWSRE